MLKVALGQPIRSFFKITQWTVYDSLHEGADNNGRQDYEPKHQDNDLDRVGFDGLVKLSQRVNNIQHAQHRLVRPMGMAARAGTGGLVPDHCRAAQHVLTIIVGKKPGSADHGARRHGFFILVAGQAGFGFLIDQGSNFILIGRMNHHAGLAQNPYPVNVVQGAHVLDDLGNVGLLVLQHRGAGAFGDDFR